MSIPGWFPFILLSLAAFRTWRLVADDDITDPLKRYVTALPKAWHDPDPLPANYRQRLMDFIECPWCLGFWIGLAWWGAWQVWPHATTVVAVPMALSALVPFFEKVSSSD